jgi:hypothetical protein
MLDFAPVADTPTSRRANANAAQASGVPAGPPAPPDADCEPSPNHDNTPSTTLFGGCTAAAGCAAGSGSDVSEKLDTDGTDADGTVPVEPPDATAAADRRPGAGSDVEPNDGEPLLLLPPRLLLLLPLVPGLAAPEEATPAPEIAERCFLPNGPVTDVGREPGDDDPKPAPLGEPDDEPPDASDTEVLAPPEADAPDDDEAPDAVEPPEGEVPPDEAVVPDDPVVVVVDEPGDVDSPDADAFDVPAEEPADEDDPLEPAEPAEPVPSAKATPGVDAIAAPTPKATASAATRPMYRAYPASSIGRGGSPGPLYRIGRTAFSTD